MPGKKKAKAAVTSSSSTGTSTNDALVVWGSSDEDIEEPELNDAEREQRLEEKAKAVRTLRNQTQRTMHNNRQQSASCWCCRSTISPSAIAAARRELNNHDRRLESFHRSHRLLKADVLSFPKPQLDKPPSRKYDLVPMAERQYDIFINHCQSSGQDQCKALAQMLKCTGRQVWYDMQAQDLTERRNGRTNARMKWNVNQ